MRKINKQTNRLNVNFVGFYLLVNPYISSEMVKQFATSLQHIILKLKSMDQHNTVSGQIHPYKKAVWYCTIVMMIKNETSD